MLFNSPEFIFLFLPAALVLHFSLARVSIDAALVGTTLSCLVFYAWWNPPYVALPIASIAANFWIATRVAGANDAVARRWFVAGICANVLVLCYYKYADFLLSIVDGHKAVAPNVPLALSFITFVQIAFLYDVHRRRVILDFKQYALFAVFFPHLIAGPIVRWHNLGRQLSEADRYRVNWDNIALGLTIFVFGLVKKVLIADALAPSVGTVFEAATRGEPLTAVAAWGGNFAFLTQLYFDFSGYSDMAVGLGLLFNFRLPINFAAPLRSVNIFHFWRRWHITLSQLARDLVYVPLSRGNKSMVRRSFNLVLTMTLIGIWHGAGWPFVVWGAYNGVLLLINQFWHWLTGRVGRGTPVGRLLGWALTFTAVAAGIAFFRAPDIETSWRLIKAMAGFGHAVADLPSELDDWAINHGYIAREFAAAWFGPYWSLRATVLTLLAVLVVAFVPDTLEITGYNEGEIAVTWRRDVGILAWRPSTVALAMTVAGFAASFLQIGRVRDFIYYQF
ncbi:MAG TPA: MBOAT family O-acyltransferase [Xanthobacteraceae bacterium]|nr:MBOAT family O-acyltransferase [Xanthobacteraceae bacterium]